MKYVTLIGKDNCQMTIYFEAIESVWDIDGDSFKLYQIKDREFQLVDYSSVKVSNKYFKDNFNLNMFQKYVLNFLPLYIYEIKRNDYFYLQLKVQEL